jgi:hypothetical protein
MAQQPTIDECITVKGIINDATYYSEEGWGDSVLSIKLRISSRNLRTLFPESDPRLSLILKHNNISIGHSDANSFTYYSTKLVESLKYLESTQLSMVPNQFYLLRLIRRVIHYENEYLYFESQCRNPTLERDNIVHISGLMITTPYQRKGFGTALHKNHLVYLKKSGYTHVISESIDLRSAIVMDKCGYTKIQSWFYRDFNMEIDEEYAVWIKKL